MLWETFTIAGLIFIILEMVVPSMFFLNLAVAAIITALTAIWITNWPVLIIIFAVLSIVSILFLRPLLIKNKKDKESQTGMESKYIGKIVKVIEPISKFSGAITIYDERWEARVDSDETIPVGSEVKIVKNESLVLTVEKI